MVHHTANPPVLPTCFEGSAPAPTPSNTTSIQRNPIGFDSNKNNTDFTTGSPSPTSSNVVDNTPPTVIALSPANNATNAAANFTATIYFNENIKLGTGSIVIKKVSDNTVVQTIDAAAGVNVSNKDASFTVSGLQANTSYYIEVSAGAFADFANNNFAGISGNTSFRFTTGTIVYAANFNFCSASITEGFTQYSVTGAQTWMCTSFGKDTSNSPTGSAPNGVQINGYDATVTSNVPNEDWLISPAFNLTATTYPLLSFWSRNAFNGDILSLKVSTNYSGSGDPRLATWTDLNGRFPAPASDVWTLSSQINLSSFKQANVYIAFVYVSSDEEGARWTLDDITLDNSTTPPPPSLTVSTNDIQFGFAAANNSLVKTFVVTGNDIIAPINIIASSNFTVSQDGTDFFNTIVLPQASSNNVAKTVYVKFYCSAKRSKFFRHFNSQFRIKCQYG